MKPKVILRADGNSEIGLGHVIRSLALAEMLKEDFDCIFATRFLTDYINTEASKVCKEIIKLPESDEHFNTFLSLLSSNEIVVLDNYFYRTEYQQTIKDKGCKLVCIDDIHDTHFVADVVINHAGGIPKNSYSIAPYTSLFLGPDYALLRPEFLNKTKKNNASTLLICLGGADKENITLKILKLLEDKQFLLHKCYVIIGDAFQYEKDLVNFKQSSKLNIEIFKNLSAQQMANIMSECRYAICPPSTVAYEYLSKRGGELYLKIIADNQKDIYAFYIKNSIAFDIADIFVNDPSIIQQSIEIQKKYFDGLSRQRIRSIFNKLNNEQQLKLRKAEQSDCDLYFNWVNDTDERKNAISVEPICYEEHCAWFAQKVISKDTYLWVLEQNETPIGQIRFDVDRNLKRATISYFIDKHHRDKGFGFAIVKMGIEKLFFTETTHLSLYAIVRQSNISSTKIFEQLNFDKKRQDEIFLEYSKK
jgi:UDP-2,4-diacetamido-2,4,6-trideoxy-beta-L-altropyranose hydrolase